MAGLETDKVMFKPMTYEELNISLERLQRFNNPFRKYDRVYREILIKHLISPKISLKNYYAVPFGTISFLTQLIWNESVRRINPDCTENYRINEYLFYEEVQEFSAKEILKRIVFSGNISGFAKPANFAEDDFACDEKVLKDLFEGTGIDFKYNYPNHNFIDAFANVYIAVRMNFPINIDGFLQITEGKKNVSNNIKRLIWLNNLVKTSDFSCDFRKIYKLAEEYRNNYASRKPLKLVLLVEGATEEVLLPIFSSISGVDFDRMGIEIVASGGKNQVAKIYSEIKQETNLPIFIILDADAEEIAEEIKRGIREQDSLHLISGGEFEDILPDKLICRAVNDFYGLTGNIKKDEININTRKTECLANIWKQKGFGEFKKAEFAQIIAENIKTAEDLSGEMKVIISNIKNIISR